MLKRNDKVRVKATNEIHTVFMVGCYDEKRNIVNPILLMDKNEHLVLEEGSNKAKYFAKEEIEKL